VPPNDSTLSNLSNGQFPLAAIELTNTSQSGMPAGAATLYEATNNGNQFVGDAQLNMLPASDKRYVAYALDQKISIAQRNENTNKLKGYSLNGPRLNSEYAYENMAVFTIKSTHHEPRDVVVEVPIQGGDWQNRQRLSPQYCCRTTLMIGGILTKRRQHSA
jgi:hypothetical protein